MSCQLHSITSGQSNSVISKFTLQNSFSQTFSQVNPQNQSVRNHKTKHAYTRKIPSEMHEKRTHTKTTYTAPPLPTLSEGQLHSVRRVTDLSEGQLHSVRRVTDLSEGQLHSVRRVTDLSDGQLHSVRRVTDLSEGLQDCLLLREVSEGQLCSVSAVH